MHVSLNGINLSKYVPIVMTISAPLSVQKVAWHKANDAHAAQYKECLDDKLNDIELPNEALFKKNVLCVNFNHKCMLNKLCKDLIMSCIDVSNEVLPQSQESHTTLLE